LRESVVNKAKKKSRFDKERPEDIESSPTLAPTSFAAAQDPSVPVSIPTQIEIAANEVRPIEQGVLNQPQPRLNTPSTPIRGSGFKTGQYTKDIPIENSDELPKNTKLQLIEEFETTKCQGIHIHCPEGSVSKDGPSAGAAITSTLFSLFNKKEIRNDIAITGEIDLQGDITEIGGLDMKIDGGIRAGVKHFLYPEANHSDFLKWKEKNETKSEKIVFDKVSTIKEVFQYIFA
jgi:hypothetical protein